MGTYLMYVGPYFAGAGKGLYIHAFSSNSNPCVGISMFSKIQKNGSIPKTTAFGIA